MLFKMGELRHLIREIAASEDVLDKVSFFAKKEGFGWEVLQQMVKDYAQELHGDVDEQEAFGYYFDRINEKYYTKVADIGDLVIADDWPDPEDLWIVKEKTHMNDLSAYNLRTGKLKILTSWYVIPSTDVLNRTIERLLNNGAVDWRPDEKLPEDDYAL